MNKSTKCGKTKSTKKKWNIQVLQKIISFCKLNTKPSDNQSKDKGMALGFGIKIFQIPKSRFIADQDEGWEWFPVK